MARPPASSIQAVANVIECLLRTAWVGKTPEEINAGDCAKFAEDARRMLEASEEYTGWMPNA